MTQAQSTSRSESISLRQVLPGAIAGAPSLAGPIAESQPGRSLKAPQYLTAHYWWAYVHPRAIWFFERQWLVNLILWGNYTRLRNAAMAELGDVLPGATLQVACVYGDLTGELTQPGRDRRRQAGYRRRTADAARKPAKQAAIRGASAVALDGFR